VVWPVVKGGGPARAGPSLWLVLGDAGTTCGPVIDDGLRAAAARTPDGFWITVGALNGCTRTSLAPGARARASRTGRRTFRPFAALELPAARRA
jgi:hypothetical protein